MTTELLSAAEIAVHRGREGVLYQLNASPWTVYKRASGGGLEAVGSGGGGSGDLLAANNLSDVANAATARDNLGLEIGADVQAYSANLDEYAAVNPSAAGLALLDDADGAAQLATMAGTAATGSGGVVRATSPTLVTPVLGTPGSGNLSNCTAFPATALTAPTPVTLSGATNLDAATHGGRLLICGTAATHVILDDTAGAWAAGAVVYGVNTSAGVVTIARDTTGTENAVTADSGYTLAVPAGQVFSFYRTGADAWRGGAPLPHIGKEMIPVLAAGMSPSATGGCAALATIASASNQPDIQTLDFDTTTQEYAQFSIPMPESWNEGTLTFQPIWSHAATTTNFGVVWDLQAVAVSNDDAVAVAFGTAQTSSDTGGTTNDLYVGPESSAITVSGTPAAGDTVFFRISRVTSDGGDTMAIDARLHGVRLYFTTAAGIDT